MPSVRSAFVVGIALACVAAPSAQSGSEDISVHTTKLSFVPGATVDKPIGYACEPSSDDERLVCTARVPAGRNIRVAAVQVQGEEKQGRFQVEYSRYAYSAEITFERVGDTFRFESASGNGDAAGTWNLQQPGGAPRSSGPATVGGKFHSDHIRLTTETNSDGAPRAILEARYTVQVGAAWGIFAAADDSRGARERCRTGPCTAHSACGVTRCHVTSRVDVTPSSPKDLGYKESPARTAIIAGASAGATGTLRTEQGPAHLLLIAPSRPLNYHRDSGRRLGVVALPGSRCIASGTWGPDELGRTQADDDGIATFHDELLDWVRRGDRRTEGGGARIRVSCERDAGDQTDVVRTFTLD